MMADLRIAIALVTIALLAQSSVSLTHKGGMEEEEHMRRILVEGDVGDIHNRIMMQVNERLMNETPRDYYDYSMVMAKEMNYLCHEENDQCRTKIIESIVASGQRRLKREEADDKFDLGSLLPDALDDKTKAYYQSISNVLKNAHTESAEGNEALVDVQNIEKEIKDITDSVMKSDAHYGVKTAINAVSSIALKSTIYWTEALQDKHNSFRRLRQDYHRSLQFEVFDFHNFPFINPIDVVIADFIGAVVGSVDPLIDLVFTGYNDTFGLLFSVVGTSACDSLTAAGFDYFPEPGDLVRCVLEGLLQDSGCTLSSLFFNDTNSTEDEKMV